ncbi:MAG: transposase [Patescibacteria group bacterium]
MCKENNHWFEINFNHHNAESPPLWVQYIDGLAFRKLGAQINYSGVQVYNKVIPQLEALPDNIEVTKEYCDMAKMSGTLIVDGKFVKVRGHNKKIPFIFGIDYESHDIVNDQLSLAEDGQTFDKFFRELKQAGYPLKIVVSDDRAGLKTACLRHYPGVLFQTCVGHFMENLRKLLSTRTDDKYQHFLNSLKLHVFTEPRNMAEAIGGLMLVRDNHGQTDPTVQNIILEIHSRQDEFFAYHKVTNCPNNTNLIELFNSHLNGRLETIKGFTSFKSAAQWLNGWVLRRRTKKFTDCDKKFKHLNGKCSLEMTIKKQPLWAIILQKLYKTKIPKSGIQEPEI